MCPRTDGLKDRDRLIVACRIPSADDDPKFEVTSNNTSFIIHRHCQTVGRTDTFLRSACSSLRYVLQSVGIESRALYPSMPQCHERRERVHSIEPETERKKDVERKADFSSRDDTATIAWGRPFLRPCIVEHLPAAAAAPYLILYCK